MIIDNYSPTQQKKAQKCIGFQLLFNYLKYVYIPKDRFDMKIPGFTPWRNEIQDVKKDNAVPELFGYLYMLYKGTTYKAR